MSLNNINVMGWTTNPRRLNHERVFAMGSKYIMPVPLGRVLPFVLPRNQNMGSGLTRFTILSESGAAFELVTELQDAGLRYENVGSTDQIKFLDSSPLAGTWEPGCYRAIMSDGFTTWYSDFFTWVQDVEELVKVEWSHNVPLELPGGTVTYGFPFKLRAYFKTDIAKPSYQYQNDVDRRETIDFPFLSVSYKLYQFTVIAPEYLLDCLRLIPIHHNVEITHLGDLIEVDKITMGNPEWIERGDVAGVTFTFRSGSTVSTYGERSGAGSSVPSINCTPTDYVATTGVSASQAPNQEQISSFVPETPGYVLRFVSSLSGSSDYGYLWYVPEPGTATQQDGTAGQVLFVQSSNLYYLWDATFVAGGGGAYVLPRIVSVTDGPAYTLTGYVPAGLTAQIWFRTENGSWQPHSTHTGAAINAGVSLGSDPSTWLQTRLVLSSASCGELQTTSPYTLNQQPMDQLTGIGYQRVEITTIVG